jgi:hypothetical protein
MHLPSRALAFVWGILIFLAAVAAAWILFQVEPPVSGLEARTGAPLAAVAPEQYPGPEHTRRFDVAAAVTEDGKARITETIVQDFGVVPRHGIIRVIPVRDDEGVRRISDLVVSTSRGTPGNVDVSTTSDTVTIRIGDPGITVDGAHAYRLAYTLAPATLEAGARRTRLRIDAISAWEQTIDRLSYTVTSPASPLTLVCFEGSLGTRVPCTARERTPTGGVFRGETIAPNDTFTVDLTWPRGAVAVGAAIPALDDRDWAYAVALAVAVALIAWAYRRRWRRLYARAESQLWTTFGPDAGVAQTESYDLTAEPAIEFVPPMRLRPGEMGVLIEAGPVRVLTATVIDLAARGALKITETAESWDLQRTGSVELTDDEQRVMSTLFGDADAATLAGRERTLGSLSHSLSEDLTDDLEDRGLAVKGATAASLSSQAHGARVFFLGLVALVIGSFVHAVGVEGFGADGAFVAQVAVTALVLAVGAFFILRSVAHDLSPLGLAAIWRVRGFEKFFAGSEAMHARAAADAGLLRQYMGYAIVFGHVDEWIAAFSGTDTSDWFETSGPLPLSLYAFMAPSLWTAPPAASSSSSGFSSGFSGGGGGIGGGGGGSW